MRAGMSTACLYPMELEKAFRLLAESGIQNMEIFVNSHCELYEPYLSDMLAAQREYGVRVVSVHPFTCGIESMMLFTEYERRVDDILEYYKIFFDRMNQFGAEFFILHGNKSTNYCPEERYFERFLRLQETAGEFGVTAAQENVARCVSGSLGFLSRMKAALGDNAVFALDTKQALRAGHDPIEVVRKLGGNIRHVHFSDSGSAGDCLLFGKGDYDNLTLFRELQAAGFDGTIALELYRNGYGSTAELIDNYRVLKKYLEGNGF